MFCCHRGWKLSVLFVWLSFVVLHCRADPRQGWMEHKALMRRVKLTADATQIMKPIEIISQPPTTPFSGVKALPLHLRSIAVEQLSLADGLVQLTKQLSVFSVSMLVLLGIFVIGTSYLVAAAAIIRRREGRWRFPWSGDLASSCQNCICVVIGSLTCCCTFVTRRRYSSLNSDEGALTSDSFPPAVPSTKQMSVQTEAVPGTFGSSSRSTQHFQASTTGHTAGDYRQANLVRSGTDPRETHNKPSHPDNACSAQHALRKNANRYSKPRNRSITQLAALPESPLCERLSV